MFRFWKYAFCYLLLLMLLLLLSFLFVCEGQFANFCYFSSFHLENIQRTNGFFKSGVQILSESVLYRVLNLYM